MTRAAILPMVQGVPSYELPEWPVSVCPAWCESPHVGDDEHHLLPELAKSGDAVIDVVQDDAEHASPTAVLFWRGLTVIPHLTRETCADLLELLPQMTQADLRDLANVLASAEGWFARNAQRSAVKRV